MEVLVFKTSLVGHEEINLVKPVLAGIKNIRQWNFDLDDCDKILRVVSEELDPKHVELALQQAGFNCLELEG